MNRHALEKRSVFGPFRKDGMLAIVCLALWACDAHAMSIKYSRSISMVFEPTVSALSGEQRSRLQSMSADTMKKCQPSPGPYILIVAKGASKELSTPRTKGISDVFAAQGFSREWICEFGEESDERGNRLSAVEIEIELVCSPKEPPAGSSPP